MIAATITAPEKIELRRMPKPAAPADGLLLKVGACGVCDSDLGLWRGGPPPGSSGIVPGHEVAGVVAAVGERAPGYQAGERLAVAPGVHCGECGYCRRGRFNLCDRLRFLGLTPGCPGGFAGYLHLTGEILACGTIHRIPNGLSFAHAALAEPLASVLACHAKAGTGLEDVVAVLGAGPAGCLHVSVARARGAQVILVEPDPLRRALAAEFGPDEVVDPSQEGAAARVRSLTGGLGPSIVICTDPAAGAQALELVRKGGRVILSGGLPEAGPSAGLDPLPLPARRIHCGEIEVAGAFSYHPLYHELALAVLARGLIPAAAFITHTFPLEKTADAFAMAARGEALKVMVLGTA